MTLTVEQVQGILETLVDTEAGVSLLKAGKVQRLEVANNVVSLDLQLGYPVQSRHKELQDWLESQLRAAGAREVDLNISSEVTAHAAQSGLKLLPGVRNIIA